MTSSPSPAGAIGIGNAPLQRLVEATVDSAMILLDIEGIVVAWGQGAERMFGYTAVEMLGCPVAAVFTEDDRQKQVPEQQFALATERGHAQSIRWYRRKDGSRIWAEGALTAVGSAAGDLLGFCVTLHDVTDRRRVNEALQTALARERRIAEVLQRPLSLPIPADAFLGIEIVTRYEAALTEALVGGDFFDAFELPQGRLAFVVADASGKGLSAAARAIHMKEVLRAFAREYPQSPDRIAVRVNDYACDIARLDENSDSAFVSLNLVVFDPRTGAASVVNAGAEPPLVIRTGPSGPVVAPVRDRGAGNLPLGIRQGERYRVVTTKLRHGDVLLMATDGMTEARRPPRDFLGLDGLSQLARTALAAPESHGIPGLQKAAGRIVEGARTFANGIFRDDVCLLLARRV